MQQVLYIYIYLISFLFLYIYIYIYSFVILVIKERERDIYTYVIFLFRFHVLSEFDQGKRSCRKRLADHNRRRRKSQDLMTMTTTPVATTNTNALNETNNTGETPGEKILFTSASSSSTNNPQPPFMGCITEPESPCTGMTSPTAPPSQVVAPQMALGLGCYSHDSGVMVVPASAGLSGSSSTGTSPQDTPSFLPTGLGDHFRMNVHHRFPSWSDGEDGSTMRDLFQSK